MSFWSNATGLGKRGFLFRFPGGVVAVVFILLHHIENSIAFTWVDYANMLVLLAVPHFFLWRYMQSGNSKTVAFRQIKYDLFLTGCIAGGMDMAVIPSVIFMLTATTSYISADGFTRLYNLLLIPFGVIVITGLQGLHFHFESSELLAGLSLAYAVYLFTVLAYVSYTFARHQYLDKILIRKQKLEIDEKAEMISMQTEELRSLNESLHALNESLEKNIADRTEDLKRKNKKLSQYAFTNVHKLGSPVAKILGLARLLNDTSLINKSEESEIVVRLNSATIELDTIVTKIKFDLEKENLIDSSLLP